MNCDICYDDYNSNEKKPFTLVPCGHTFCIKCINSLMSREASCPNCRKKISEKIPNYGLVGLLELNLVPDLNTDLKKSISLRQNEIKEAKEDYDLKFNKKLNESNKKIEQIKSQIVSHSDALIQTINQNKTDVLNEIQTHSSEFKQRLDSLNSSQSEDEIIDYNWNDLSKLDRNELNNLLKNLYSIKSKFNSKLEELNRLGIDIQFKCELSVKPDSNLIGNLIRTQTVISDVFY